MSQSKVFHKIIDEKIIQQVQEENGAHIYTVPSRIYYPEQFVPGTPWYHYKHKLSSRSHMEQLTVTENWNTAFLKGAFR